MHPALRLGFQTLRLFKHTSAFSVNKVQALITFTLVRAASVDTLVELVRAIVQVFIQTLVDIWKENQNVSNSFQIYLH